MSFVSLGPQGRGNYEPSAWKLVLQAGIAFVLYYKLASDATAEHAMVLSVLTSMAMEVVTVAAILFLGASQKRRNPVSPPGAPSARGSAPGIARPDTASIMSTFLGTRSSVTPSAGSASLSTPVRGQSVSHAHMFGGLDLSGVGTPNVGVKADYNRGQSTGRAARAGEHAYVRNVSHGQTWERPVTEHRRDGVRQYHSSRPRYQQTLRDGVLDPLRMDLFDARGSNKNAIGEQRTAAVSSGPTGQDMALSSSFAVSPATSMSVIRQSGSSPRSSPSRRKSSLRGANAFAAGSSSGSPSAKSLTFTPDPTLPNRFTDDAVDALRRWLVQKVCIPFLQLDQENAMQLSQWKPPVFGAEYTTDALLEIAMQLPSHAQTLCHARKLLQRYVSVPGYPGTTEYCRYRIAQWCTDTCMSKYVWNGFDAELTQKLPGSGSRVPTDAELIVTVFGAYFDQRMPSAPNPLSSDYSSRFLSFLAYPSSPRREANAPTVLPLSHLVSAQIEIGSDGRPYLATWIAQLLQSQLENWKMKAGGVIVRSLPDPPHFLVLGPSFSFVDLPSGRNNAFFSILALLTLIQRDYDA
ncbi:hypothetical protein FVE85_5162 [Porphyridium purpureum]|uniref:Uncharacterized protein n=1 Tax=Porphyridium purpureum TaxID=35688 RepID=A0A5J4Z4Q9_PORPP|nr:hypothetical protein FVE85_5162 [Porphyridium purpureum]|eukprot:POR7473..scf295_1